MVGTIFDLKYYQSFVSKLNDILIYIIMIFLVGLYCFEQADEDSKYQIADKTEKRLK